ncbi:MAG: flagellar protein FlgN [Deferribacteraceae bacterium]|nr:flagellar protein FlgN [Deferribacteraceae bacterium]
MENIRHLVEVLKSQVSLYSELSELMASEKQAIVSWLIEKTVEITKRKEALLRKERIQSEARNALLSKIAAEQNVASLKILDIIYVAREKAQTAEGDAEATRIADELAGLCDKVTELVANIHAENISLKILYATNNRLINDFFTQSGLTNVSAAGYGPNGGNRRMSSMQRVG